MREIYTDFENCLSEDTNVQITVSSGDKTVTRLAKAINLQLTKLRKSKQQYSNGDRELKEAVTNISHDLRTPLTAICGYLDLLETEELTENTKRYTEQIKNRTETLKALTEELFRYSVISSVSEPHFENVNVGRVLEDTLISFYEAFEQKGITPNLTLPAAPVLRTLDKSALSRIFGNVINNAVKYSDGDFAVSMTDSGEITFSNTASELSLVDVGKLFDRFYTVDSARKSTGLGLSIAKLLTERMKGEISADYKDNVLSIIVSFQ
jgi:signal transduction histidine kinase